MSRNRAGRLAQGTKLSREIRDIGEEAGVFMKKAI
jgi:hypothetical protein